MQCERCIYNFEPEQLKDQLCAECIDILETDKAKCACCNEHIDEIELYGNVTDNGYPICESCHSDETSDPDIEITVHHSKGDQLDDNFDLIWIGSYTHQSSDCPYMDDFDKVDHYSNYRGYTDIVSDKWTEIGLVNVRQFDESQEHLAKGVNSFGDMLLDKGIIYASAQCRTSNCMVVNLSYWVLNEDYKKAMTIKRKLMKKYNLDKDDF